MAHVASGVAAIVLAAGSSRRFAGGSKLLAEVAGRPLIAWAVSAFAASRAAEVIVVTGPEPQRVEDAVSGFAVRFVHNPDHLSGMGGSVAIGIKALAPDYSRALISPGDMPGITADLVNRLIESFEANGSDRIIRPKLPDGRLGHPVLWPRRHFAKLAQLRGPTGGKQLMGELVNEIDYLPWPDSAAALDIDTLEDLDRYRLAKRDLHDS